MQIWVNFGFKQKYDQSVLKPTRTLELIQDLEFDALISRYLTLTISTKIWILQCYTNADHASAQRSNAFIDFYFGVLEMNMRYMNKFHSMGSVWLSRD